MANGCQGMARYSSRRQTDSTFGSESFSSTLPSCKPEHKGEQISGRGSGLAGDRCGRKSQLGDRLRGFDAHLRFLVAESIRVVRLGSEASNQLFFCAPLSFETGNFRLADPLLDLSPQLVATLRCDQ